MKINLDNAAKVEAALATINGAATSFAVIFASDVRAFAMQAERQLSALPRAERQGAIATCLPAGPSANAYRYNAVATLVTLQRGATGWFLVEVAKAEVSPKSSEKVQVTITQAQADEIQRRSVQQFHIV